jgi:hypothetical protein
MVLTPRAVNQIPTTGHAPRKKCKATAVVEGSVLEDQTTEVAVSCNDVVSLFFLTELVTVVLGFNFSGFTNQEMKLPENRALREQRTTEYTSHTQACGRGASKCCAQLGIQS